MCICCEDVELTNCTWIGPEKRTEAEGGRQEELSAARYLPARSGSLGR